MRLKEIFSAGHFAPAASVAEITQVENELGITLPDQLRALYLQCDGFREPRGNSKYLFALLDEDSIGSLVSVTRFWWHEWNEIVPDRVRIDFRPFVFFGSSIADHTWAIRWNGPAEIIAYHHHMESQYEIVGSDIITVYQRDDALCDKLGR